MNTALGAADYPRTYRMTVWGRVLLLFVSFALAAFGVFVGYLLGSKNPSGPLIVIVLLATLLPGLLLFVAVLRGRIVLTADAIELHGVFSVTSLTRADIAGRRAVQYRGNTTIQLVPRAEEMKTLKFSPTSFKTDSVLDTWVASLPDLDALDIKAEEAQLASDPELGTTPQERLAHVAGARKFANAFNVAALCAALWAYLYPRPYIAAVLTVAILPWAALFIVARSDGLYRLLARRNQVRPSLALPVLMPGFVLLMLSFQIGVLDVQRALTWAAVVGVILAGVAFMSDATMRGQGSKAILWMLLLFPYGYGSVVLGNRALDHSAGTDYQVEVLGRRVQHGKSNSYHLMLAPWGPRSEPREVTVSGTLYAQEARGSRVCIHKADGALGIGWYVVARCW